MNAIANHLNYEKHSSDYLFVCLNRMIDQIEEMERKLTIKVNEEVMDQFYKQHDHQIKIQQSIRHLKRELETVMMHDSTTNP